MKFIAFLITLTILISLIEKIISKVLGVQKEKISETPGKNIDRWVRSILIVVFLLSVSPLNTNNPDINMILMLYWITMLGFQAFMEYIYIKDSKQYISTTILLILGLIIIYNFAYFYNW